MTTTALTSQGHQPGPGTRGSRAPPAVTTVLAQARPTPLASSSRLPGRPPLPVLSAPAPTPSASSQSLAKHPAGRTSRKAVRQVASAPSLAACASASCVTSGISTRRHTRGIMESSSDPGSDDALPRFADQELLGAFRQRHCISINSTDGTKLDNGFTKLIGYAITHHYPTLEFLSTTGRTTFVEDMTRKYEHDIQRTIQNIETHDFWNMHCNNMLILDRERRKRHGKGQPNAQVSFEAAKRAPISYYYRCKYTSTSVCVLSVIYIPLHAA